MPILAHDVEKQKLDVIHISEAGLQKKDPMGLHRIQISKTDNKRTQQRISDMGEERPH